MDQEYLKHFIKIFHEYLIKHLILSMSFLELSQESYLNLNVADNFFASNQAKVLNVFIKYLQKWLSISFIGHDAKTVSAKYSSYQIYAQCRVEMFNFSFY